MNPCRATQLCAVLLISLAASAKAQTTWNYFLSDAGGGNSLLTWNVTGSLATPPGAVRLNPSRTLAFLVRAPGIYNNSFSAGDTLLLTTPDGSYLQYGTGIYDPIVSYYTDSSPSGSSFGLVAQLLPPQTPGRVFLYYPGTQSALIPIAFSNFNPGTYQSLHSDFDTPVTVTLTIGSIPEPSLYALLGLTLLLGLFAFMNHSASRFSGCR